MNADPVRAAALAVATLFASGAAPAPVMTRDAAARVLTDAAAAAEKGDCSRALMLIGSHLQEPRFAELPAEARAAGYGIGAECALRADHKNAAYGYALAGTALPESEDRLWYLRLWLEVDADRPTAGLATVRAMTDGRGAALNAIPQSTLFQLDDKLKLADPAGRVRLLGILTSSGYQPDNAVEGVDAFRWRLAEVLHARGDHAGAAELVRAITNPDWCRVASLDRRYRALFPADYDNRADSERELARLQDLSARQPDSLHAVVAVADTLRSLGRAEDAIALLQAAKPAAPGATTFADSDEWLNWCWNSLALGYLQLARETDTLDAFQAGVGADEHGKPNVSQLINMAEVQVIFGHSQRALAMLSGFDPLKGGASPYGLMQLHGVRACANARAGDARAAVAELAYLTGHEADDPAAATDAMLCVGDLDGAAAALIRRLANPEQQTEALLRLSSYDPQNAALPPHPYLSRISQLTARADVQAAITRAGGTRRFHVQQPDF